MMCSCRSLEKDVTRTRNNQHNPDQKWIVDPRPVCRVVRRAFCGARSTLPNGGEMSQETAAAQAPAIGGRDTTTPPDSRRWLALAVIALAQLMVVLDATVV